MRIGPTVRRLLGPLEGHAADAYRGLFIDLDDLGRTLGSLGAVGTILEVGAGDGCLATRVCSEFPDARYLGVDIVASPGKLFKGDSRRAEFRSQRVEDIKPERVFDMVLLVDVLHHIPKNHRRTVLAAAAGHVRPGGLLVVKDWIRGRNLGHLLAYISDRFITGDKNVAFFGRSELLGLITETLPQGQLRFESRVPPRRNNLLLIVQVRALQLATSP
jgi:SAM-dependent methyltransferase